ncbi:sprT-like domain-containing protein Spartan [Sitophilus oryzae]|uniref:Protein with SprT-like domain at the N terminus n=1 Tax=Sitophilus oryzae TaxID=7048 RepID=A0A6J2Y5B7_SITOR|nr:sprT-like domain-containing protein Spartan [Sitophilus oryzae]
MGEVDFQTALLLQYKFDQEAKHTESTDSDYQLALQLQEQFKSESDIEKPRNNLAYDVSSANKSKCLVDPSWEVIDPTPDVHVLFVTFNERFFWNKLLAVTVSWSKRMTSCAGICSYQGRAGMCSITLSEPLLKLRPRKDLVETLLHEMIHAYLFVTHNNRDRDGHGPEFHKHMYRINAETGTNITVYHSFHDEVRLYQQHWWRCDGPCQNRKPYFGMVRRATNRAPGPNDRWWAEHSRNCGGNFIKVKSPEPHVKSNKKNTTTGTVSNTKDSKNDIRKYISNVGSGSASNKENQPKNSKTSFNTSTISKPDLVNNIRSISNNVGGSQISNVIPSKSSNIFGFTGLGNGTTSSVLTPKKGSTSGMKGVVKNAGGSTFVVTKQGNQNNNTVQNTKLMKATETTVEVFSGTGRALGASSVPQNNSYSVVREHWLNKFDNKKAEAVKRPSTDVLQSSAKVAKSSGLNKIADDYNTAECPVCSEKIHIEILNEHLDHCLELSKEEIKECIICGQQVANTEYEVHTTKCTEKHFGEDADLDYANISKDGDVIDLTQSDSHKKQCPACKAELSNLEYDCHVEQCLLKMYDQLDEKYKLNKDIRTTCVACSKKILKSEMDYHLEECLGMSNIFDMTNVPVEEIEDIESNKYNCPFCLNLVLESEMQCHLNICLKTNEENDKSILIDSLCSSDFESD